MNIKFISICIASLSTIALQNAVPQSLGPADISGFGKDHPVQASITDISTSICRVVSSTEARSQHQDVKFSGRAIFENRSRKAVILYKHPFVLTVRIASSPMDLTSGPFVAGFDGDRMAISSTPKQTSIDDFAIIGPGKRYAITTYTMAPIMAASDTPQLKNTGKYWVQLGLDARPDAFYYEPTVREDFIRTWKNRGELVEFVLAKPFVVTLTLDSNVPLCKE
jgi:hypothetical protein